MKIARNARRFIRMEDGLVTVEWVALTAGMVVAAVAIGFIVMHNTGQEAKTIGSGIGTNVTSVYGADASAAETNLTAGSSSTTTP